MKFLHLHLFHKEVEFGNIEGYDDIKDLVRRALDSDENYNLLFMWSTGQCKDVILAWNSGMQKRCLLRWLKYH